MLNTEGKGMAIQRERLFLYC